MRRFRGTGSDSKMRNTTKSRAPTSVQTVGIISRPRRTDIAKVAPGLLAWLQERGVNVFCDSETAECIPSSCNVKAREEIPAVSDLLIVLGGDGTLLAVARLLGERNVPILPVNLGGLGFLTSVTLDDLYPVLEQAINGEARYSERVLLETRVMRQGKPFHCARALNDAVLNKAALARIIDLELRVNDEFVCNYKADGLIVATPTGSTAYSLSAGGPILYPVVSAFVITPICPHTLTNRPLVIPDNAKIEIGFAAGEAPIYLTVDGQVGVALVANDVVALSAAAERLRLVRPQQKTYFSVLRDKLKWGER
jgi:NAD+ kinase